MPPSTANTPRGLFDAHFLLANEGITPALKDTFLIYLISSNRPMAELLAPNQLDLKAVYVAELIGMTNTPVALEVAQSGSGATRPTPASARQTGASVGSALNSHTLEMM
ncbi:MAG: hypothetical protein ACFCUG_07290 [Thiotrichales bacterium]